jgi:hypothetical protein
MKTKNSYPVSKQLNNQWNKANKEIIKALENLFEEDPLKAAEITRDLSRYLYYVIEKVMKSNDNYLKEDVLSSMNPFLVKLIKGDELNK